MIDNVYIQIDQSESCAIAFVLWLYTRIYPVYHQLNTTKQIINTHIAIVHCSPNETTFSDAPYLFSSSMMQECRLCRLAPKCFSP